MGGDRDEAHRDAVAYSTFGGSRPGWLSGLGRILDVGAGRGTQSIRLARAGHQVLAVEPDPGMRSTYGVRIAVDQAELDPPPPSDPREPAAPLDVEERLSARDTAARINTRGPGRVY